MFRLLFVICNLFGILGIWLLEFAQPSWAQCPVCVVTVGGGMLLAKKLGVDDFLISIWISALNTAIAFWLAPKIKLKFLKNPYLLSFIMYLLTLFYFQFTDQIGAENNRLLGIDKIISGQSLGLVTMFLAIFLDQYSRLLNSRKVLFPYQKVVLPLGLLLFVTIVFKLTFNL